MKPTLMGALRNRLLAPDPAEVTFERRGFRAVDPERQAALEKVGSTFLAGFGYGMEGRAVADIEVALETTEQAMRGFAFEGCTMALAIRDALGPRRRWVSGFLAGQGDAHTYMVHIGVGWAMARLPSIRWRAIMPSDPLLRWLALDGYGFHQAYFRTDQYVGQQYQRQLPVWPSAAYANRVVDQGIGRALWFVNGADADRVSASISGFAPARRSDLWSGSALASVYAGGVDAEALETMAQLAGEYLPDVAQGAAFAGKARLRADLMTPHTEMAVKVYCGMSVEEAAAVTDEALDGLAEGGPVPAFEVWRQRIRQRFA